MNRREFLVGASSVALGLAFGDVSMPTLSAASREKGRSILADMLIIDPHAHPDMDQARWQDSSASFRFMKDVGMAASCYSAIGDSAWRSRTGLSNYEFAISQINYWMETVVRKGNVKRVLKVSDIPNPGTKVPGAIFALEGGDALEGSVSRVDEFYRLGVRIITVVHYRNNEIGDIMKVREGSEPSAYNGGLTRTGAEIINRMQELGMVVDVAHCNTSTLRDITEFIQKPVIDSHTGLCNRDSNCGRLRTLKEMEMIAKTGGVVCSWPSGGNRKPAKTFHDWVSELLEMKKNLGIEHVGIGTDGGGGLSPLQGYSDVRDLGFLAEAMLDIGFSKDEIGSVMGRNVLRVMRECIE